VSPGRVRRLRRSALIPALAASPGCVPLPRGHEISSRAVAGKRDGDTLVAADGSWCRVTAAAYERARVGEGHTCMWKVDDEGRAAGSGGRRPPGRPATSRPDR
jgi:hypothetical protein